MAKTTKPNKKAEAVAKDLVVTGPQAVMVSAGRLRQQTERDKEIRKVISEYIASSMVEGKDYGTININGKESKPSLFKPGAEKFCGLFKIRPTFRKDSETVEMLGSTPGIIAYICELVDGKGLVVGEGRGSSSVKPSDSDFAVNKAVKIAEKRAQIDAVLRTGGLSDFFTQDMEDAPKEPKQVQSSIPQTTSPAKASEAQTGLITKLIAERFADDQEFTEFAKDLVGAEGDFDKAQASKLIGEMLKRPQLDQGDYDGYDQ